MTDDESCPHCGTDLRGEPIQQEYRHGDETHYSRKIGVEIRGLYDGVLFWTCPDCGKPWARFPEGDYRRAKADEVMKEWGGDG